MVANLSNVQEKIKDTKGIIKSRRRIQWTKEKRTTSQTMVDEILQKLKTKNGIGWNLCAPEGLVVPASLVATFTLCYSS